MYPIKVFLIYPDVEATNAVVEMLSNIEDIEIVGDANNKESAFYMLAELLPNVVLIDDQIQEGPYTLTEEITQRFVNMSVVVMSGEPLQESLRKALKVGARDVLGKPVEAAALAEAIYAAYDYQKKRNVAMPAPWAGDEPGRHKAKVITVFSTKGGVGKTTVAVNLAVTLAKQFEKRTVLWDLDLHHGVVAVATNIVQRRHFTDLLNDIQYLDEDLWESYLEQHESGLMVLPAPFTPEFAEFLTAEHAEKILSVARKRWDYIIVDAPSVFLEPVVEVLKQSDLILLVGSLDLGAIKNLKACMMVMDKLNFSRARMRLVVNRVGVDFGVYLKDIESTLRLPVFATIPSDAKNVLTGLNLGIPAAFRFPESEFGRSIQIMAEAIVREDKAEKPAGKKGLKESLFNRR
ncbi:MAG: AAA family ATPase [Bacillota bacterium]